MNRKALALGAFGQVAVFTALFLATDSLLVSSGSLVVGGLVAGRTSATVDAQLGYGALTTTLGAGLSWAAFGALVWFNAASLSSAARLDLTFLTLVWGTMPLIAIVPVAAFGGAFTGYLSGHVLPHISRNVHQSLE
ncbi:hypothetical protein [Halorussus salinus]|uniref:hypothetical protein n=1 Tax=Halorussus salinus TaxID=1364935 RepID=UPI0010927C0B|nr:hypothetical protein [Halorussus salinus]